MEVKVKDKDDKEISIPLNVTVGAQETFLDKMEEFAESKENNNVKLYKFVKGEVITHTNLTKEQFNELPALAGNTLISRYMKLMDPLSEEKDF